MGPEPESGMDELLRLSQKLTRTEKELTRKEEKCAERTQLVQALKDLKVSVALQQLNLVAKPEIIQGVSSLKQKAGNDDLRKMIRNLATELEDYVDNSSSSNPGIASIECSVKTLAILIELLFSLE